MSARRGLFTRQLFRVCGLGQRPAGLTGYRLKEAQALSVDGLFSE